MPGFFHKPKNLGTEGFNQFSAVIMAGFIRLLGCYLLLKTAFLEFLPLPQGHGSFRLILAIPVDPRGSYPDPHGLVPSMRSLR